MPLPVTNLREKTEELIWKSSLKDCPVLVELYVRVCKLNAEAEDVVMQLYTINRKAENIEEAYHTTMLYLRGLK